MAPDAVETFAALFRGRTDAYGINQGGVQRSAHWLPEDWEDLYREHLTGHHAIGIFPMLDDNTVWFGAVDLDEPDFELARQMQTLIPGASWLERSRSGNAHVWVFFEQPAPAWAVRAVLRGATQAVGRPDVEVFPKQDRLREGMVGNYINLPLFGDERPILTTFEGHSTGPGELIEWPPSDPALLLPNIYENRLSSAAWERRARALGAVPPSEREATAEWGTQANLHRCADYIMRHRHDHPLGAGHRHVVLFNLSKMLLNWREATRDEALRWVLEVNAAGDRPLPEDEVTRAFENAEGGQFTSTGCDDPVMHPYVDPECPIARGTVGR